MDLPRACDHKEQSIRMIRSLIDRGCTWAQTLAIAKTRYIYSGHLDSEFRKHWILAKRLADGERPTTFDGDPIPPKELELVQWQGKAGAANMTKVLTRQEALEIATEIAWGTPYVVRMPGHEGRAYEVKIVPNVKERLRAVDLIIKAQGYEAPKKKQTEVTIVQELGAAGLAIEDNGGVEDAEIVE